jgi:hypothetical protein
MIRASKSSNISWRCRCGTINPAITSSHGATIIREVHDLRLSVVHAALCGTCDSKPSPQVMQCFEVKYCSLNEP